MIICDLLCQNTDKVCESHHVWSDDFSCIKISNKVFIFIPLKQSMFKIGKIYTYFDKNECLTGQIIIIGIWQIFA